MVFNILYLHAIVTLSITTDRPEQKIYTQKGRRRTCRLEYTLIATHPTDLDTSEWSKMDWFKF